MQFIIYQQYQPFYIASESHIIIIIDNYLLQNIDYIAMFKCNEDSYSQSEEDDQISIERGLVVESLIEVDHLICSICHHIVWQPVTCGSQYGCQNAFCTFCINAWLRKCLSQDRGSPLCPQCKRTFVSSKIPPILKSLLQNLHLRCPYSAHGCQSVLTYAEVGDHMMLCQYKMRICRGCKGSVLIRDYEQHTNSCVQFIIECGYCGGSMPKVRYLTEHVNQQNGRCKRSYTCYENQINGLGVKMGDIGQSIEQLNQQCDRIQTLTKALVVGEPLELFISFYTTFNSHFTFPHPTLIKPSFNETKEKFDFLHFYITNPIYTDSFASIKWSIRVNKMMGNILLGFCSNMNINSLDYIVNKYGELKRKDIHESKYKIVRKNDFSFMQGDIIRCRYMSLLRVIRLQNQTRKQILQLGCGEVEEFAEGGKIYVFISMDTLNDSISFIS